MKMNDARHTRRREAYFRRQFCGGRNAVARAVDYVGLRLIVLVSAYLFFAPRFERRAVALLLCGIALAIAMLVLRIVREIGFERFVARETKRIRRILLCDQLLLIDAQEALGLVGGLYKKSERAVVLQRACPVDSDALLKLVRTHRGFGLLHVFSCAPFEATAAAFAARANGLLILHEPEELFLQAERSGMQPSLEAVNAYIDAAQQRRARGRRQRRIRASPFAVDCAKKYLFTALALVAASFLTRYTLYYRMLAGLCAAIAAASAATARGARTLSHETDIG